MPASTKDIKIGYELLPPEDWIAKDAFDWPEDKWTDNIHQDTYAKSLGYKGPVIVGWATVQTVIKMLLDFFGESLFSKGKIFWKTIHPVYPGNLISTRAKVVGKIPDGKNVRILVEFYQTNEDGQKVIVGNASASVV